MHGQARLLGQAAVETPEHPAAAHEVEALGQQVLGQLRRSRAQAAHDRIDDGADLLLDGLPDLLGRRGSRSSAGRSSDPGPGPRP